MKFTAPEVRDREQRTGSGIGIVVGVLLVILGLVAIARPVYATIAWGWVLCSGILEIILGIFIWSEWPFNAAWIIGLWVGISVLFNGIWIITLSSLPRSAQT